MNTSTATKNNSLLVSNLPTGARKIDLTNLASKTLILPFVGAYWVDQIDNSTGHFMLKKPEYAGFVLFVLHKYNLQKNEELPFSFQLECAQEPTTYSEDPELDDRLGDYMPGDIIGTLVLN